MNKKKKNWLEDWDENESGKNKFSFKESEKPKKDRVFLDGGIISKKGPRFTKPSDNESDIKKEIKVPEKTEEPSILEDDLPLIDKYDEVSLRDEISIFFKNATSWIYGLLINSAKQLGKVVDKPRKSITGLPAKKLSFLVLGVASIAVGTMIVLNSAGSNSNSGNSDDVTVDGGASFTQNAADFTVLKPADNPDIEIGFDPERGVASFNTQIAGVDVVVSQQPIPEAFKLDPLASLTRVANDFGANQAIELGDFQAFSGINSETSQQTVIFTKDNVLVFMNSARELNIGSLVDFIQTLE